MIADIAEVVTGALSDGGIINKLSAMFTGIEGNCSGQGSVVRLLFISSAEQH